jgi:hypothetical protein
MRAFTSRDPQRVAQEAAEREQAQAMDVAAQAVAIQQEENKERKQLDAIKILKQVLDEGNLVETALESLPDNENDDDNDDENREEYDEDEDEDDADNNSMRRSTAYQPPTQQLNEKVNCIPTSNKLASTGVYLKGVKDEILVHNPDLRESVIHNGHHWIPSKIDPIALKNPINAEPWYLSDVWCYFWDPFIQHHIGMKSCTCSNPECHATQISRVAQLPMAVFFPLQQNCVGHAPASLLSQEKGWLRKNDVDL